VRINKGQKITNVTLHLTEECNLRCDYCFVSKNPKKVSWEVAKETIDFLCDPAISGDATEVHLQFFGGEPMMQYDMIKRIVEYSKTKNKKVNFGITTNATLFNEERLDFFEKERIGVLFSIDGGEESQGIHRRTVDGRNSWPMIEKHMSDVIRIQPQITARLTYTPKTLPYLYDNFVYLVDEVGFSGCAPSCAYDSYLPFTEKDWEEWDRQYEKLAARYIERIKTEGNPGGDHYIDKCLRQIVNGNKLDSPCGAGRAFVGVSVAGTLHPCHRFVQWPEWSFGDVWRGVVDEEKRLITAQFNAFKSNPKCIDCDNGFCGGVCLAANYENSGSIFIPSKDGCIVSKKQWEVAKKIYEELKDHPYVLNMRGVGLEGKRMSNQQYFNQQGYVPQQQSFNQGFNNQEFNRQGFNQGFQQPYQQTHQQGYVPQQFPQQQMQIQQYQQPWQQQQQFYQSQENQYRQNQFNGPQSGHRPISVADVLHEVQAGNALLEKIAQFILAQDESVTEVNCENCKNCTKADEECEEFYGGDE